MGEIIAFADIVRTRRRRRERESLERCLEILRLNLAYTHGLWEDAGEPERSIYRQRAERLAELLEYGERIA